MRVLILQQQDGATPGWLGDVLEEAGVPYRVARPDRGDEFADRSQWAVVVSLGGTMDAYDTERYGFVAAEREFLRAAVRAGTPVLGICLGAQLLAAELGGRVYRMSAPRVGYIELEPTVEGTQDPIVGQAWGPVLACHSDAFDVPGEAEILAWCDGCPYAYRIGYTTWGLQFHPEASPQLVESWLASFPTEALARLRVDTDAVRREIERHAAEARRTSRRVLRPWLEATGVGQPE